MRRITALAASACLLTVAGCGRQSQNPRASAPNPPPVVVVPVQCDPPPGHGVLGACTTQPASRRLRLPATASFGQGPRYFPDTSEYQGPVDWPGAQHAGLFAVVVKAFEVNYRQDREFARSWRLLAGLHVWHAAYLFARAGDCQAIADTYVAIVNSAGGWDPQAGPPIIDAEVPSAYGMVPCLADRIRHDTGIQTVVTYTSPGTWPGGGSDDTDEWIATYGSSFGCIWTCHPIAWQYTDGVYGPGPHSVYGLGNGDVSIDYGLTTILAHPAPPGPSRAQIRSWHDASAASLRAYARHRCSMPVLGSRVCGELAWRTVHFQQLLWPWLGRPRCFGPTAHRDWIACRILRPEVAIYSRALSATNRTETRLRCRSTPTAACRTLVRRESYFRSRISAALY